jgi:hypothetical protein
MGRLDNGALHCKVDSMDSQSASAHLEVIRTLMERTALYRRALAPTTVSIGTLGLLAGVTGWWFQLGTPRGFGIGWMAVAAGAAVVALLLMRRQALRDREMFWSPPARRVAHAVLPTFTAGFVAGLLAVVRDWPDPLLLAWLPPLWMVLYGAGLHAAGFFMPRGIRLFGWVFVVAGLISAAILAPRDLIGGAPDLVGAHLVMGGVFGGLHLLYGLYLLRTRGSLTTR